MNREFLINILFLVFINLLIKPLFIFGVDLSVQNRVGEQYGVYFALLNLSYIFQIVNDFGIQNFNNRHVSRHPHLLPKYFPKLLSLKIGLSIAYVLLTVLVGFMLGYRGLWAALLLILAVNAVLAQMIFFLRTNVSGLGFYRLDSFFSALDKLLMLFTCGIALWVPPFSEHFSVETFALAQTAALALSAIIIFIVLRRLHPVPLPRIRTDRQTGIQALFLLRKSLPYALVILLMFAYSRMDAVMIERFLPDGRAQADIYAGAYRLLDACNMLGYLFAGLLLPMFAKQLKKGEAVFPLVSLSTKLIWAGSVALATTVFFAREDLVRLMMPLRASPERWETLGILIWAFVPVCLTYIFSTLLTADERLSEMNRYFIVGILIDLGLNALLLPSWGARGAAIAALSTQCFIAAALVWICSRRYGFVYSSGVLLRGAAFFAATAASNWLFRSYGQGGPWANIALSLLSAGVWAFVFGMVDWKGMRRWV